MSHYPRTLTQLPFSFYRLLHQLYINSRIILNVHIFIGSWKYTNKKIENLNNGRFIINGKFGICQHTEKLYSSLTFQKSKKYQANKSKIAS